MSGKWSSNAWLRARLAKKIALQQAIELSQSGYQSLVGGIQQLSQSELALRPVEARRCRRFLDSVQAAATVSTADSVYSLEGVANRMRKQLAEAEQLFTTLSTSQSSVEIARVEALVTANKKACMEWFSEEVEEWQRCLRQAKAKRYEQSKKHLPRIEREVNQRLNESIELNIQVATRMNLIEKFRAALHRLGFEESEGPTYEVRGDKRSHVRLRATSAAFGERTYLFSLEEGIDSSGQGAKCEEYLKRLSLLLAENEIESSFLPQENDGPGGNAGLALSIPDTNTTKRNTAQLSRSAR